ncbi:MAG: hypothetical protein EA405_10645 [Rhodospirillales bacterium]|nr:MAG: hypothetical protein EA405_10645 [Rhodospirillales bacterium]
MTQEPQDSGGPGTENTIREAVAVFQDESSLQAAVDDLLNAGFDRSELSLLAGQEAVDQKLGHVYEKVSDLEDDPSAPRVAYRGRDSLTEGRAALAGGLGYVGAVVAGGAVVATGGTLAAVIAATVAAGGGGGLLGTLAARWLGKERAKNLEAQLEHGGILLWVRVRDAAHEQRALSILSQHSTDDVHVHDLPAGTSPEGAPIDGFVPDPFLPGARV